MADAASPNNVRVRLTEDVLRELYVTQRLPLDEVARRLGVAPTTVSRRFRDLGLEARPRGPIPTSWVGGAADTAFTWTGELAWIVGLIATDGNLSSNGRTVSVTSKDVDLLESIRCCLKLNNRIAPTIGGYAPASRLQWTSRRFHCWLMSLGLTPAKSLTIGSLNVPDEYFADFLRGCIDGDGSIVTYVDRYNAPKNPTYVYDRLFVSLVSASPCFLQWVQQTVRRLRAVSGHLMVKRSTGRRDMWCLRYAKRDSVSVLKWMYHAHDVPALARKRERAERALANPTWYRHSLSGVDTR